MTPGPRPSPLSFLPSPPINGFHLGPLFIHFYGLMYVIGITLAIYIARRRLAAAGENPELIGSVAVWAVVAGIIGGRIYFDITTPQDIQPGWYGPFAVWSGGLGIWGGVAAGALAGAWRLRRLGGSIPIFMDAVAPTLLVAQAIGRIGNYFNQELFGRPSGLPWALMIDPAHRPPGYQGYATFQPTFLYEMIFDLAFAGMLVWLGHHTRVRSPGLFALYVTGYSAFRIFEESLRIDSSEHFLGLRLNFYVASVLTVAGLIWFVITQRRKPASAGPDAPPGAGVSAVAAAATGSQSRSGETTARDQPGDTAATAAG